MIPWRNLYRTLSVCGRLTRRGCRILEAHAHLDPPLIRISPPPAGVLPTYGYRSPPAGRVRVPLWCVAQVNRTRVEWVATEVHQ